jgi:AraC-like DNA-binding protein
MSSESATQVAPREICESILFAPAGLDGAVATSPKSDFVRRYEAYRDRLRFHVASSSNRCDAYAVSPGMVMAVVDVGCTDVFESPLSGQDIVEFHYRISGSILLAGRWGELCVRGPSYLLWYQPSGYDDAAERLGARDAVRETWVSLYCDRAWLYSVGGLEAATLLDELAVEDLVFTAPRFRTSPRIGEMVPVLKDIVRMGHRGPTDWLIATAKAHELLHVTLRNARLLDADNAQPPSLNERDHRRVAQAREILRDEFTAPPALGTLAHRVGLNTSRLCAGFKLQFGETTSSFIRHQRLELARKLLGTTDLQVREIARRVGYRHHGTFTAAFTRHFGIAPKLIRRC